MKVVHVETGRHLYGGAQQVLYLLQGLREGDDEHILVCPKASAIAQAAGDLARIHAFPMRGDVDPRMFLGLSRLLRRERPDLVHVHSRRGADVMGGLAARWAHVPAVVTRRVDNPEPRWQARWKYRLYARVITISEGIRRVLVDEGVPADKLVYVPSAVDTERFRPDCETAWFRETLDVPEGTAVVGMVAQLIPRKGHRVLVDALPAILRARPNTRFLLFGQGPLQEEIAEAIQRKGLSDRVALCGFRDDLERVLPCLDLLVHPASMEGLGVALLQAAACGVPIVAGRAGGIPEIVHDGVNGTLVTPGDSNALAAAVNALLADPERARAYGRAGRERVEQHFSIATMVRGNRAVYHACVFGDDNVPSAAP